MRLIFMGTPDFAVPTLAALHEQDHEIIAVYTQPPRPAGRRGLELTPSPVHREAERLAVPVRTPESLKGEQEQQEFAALAADVAVVVAYGLLLPGPILNGTRLGCYNGHASLLPRWRRGGTDQPGDHGRRPGNRNDGHERWMPASTPATSRCRSGFRSDPTRPPVNCMTNCLACVPT